MQKVADENKVVVNGVQSGAEVGNAADKASESALVDENKKGVSIFTKIKNFVFGETLEGYEKRSKAFWPGLGSAVLGVAAVAASVFVPFFAPFALAGIIAGGVLAGVGAIAAVIGGKAKSNLSKINSDRVAERYKGNIENAELVLADAEREIEAAQGEFEVARDDFDAAQDEVDGNLGDGEKTEELKAAKKNRSDAKARMNVAEDKRKAAEEKVKAAKNSLKHWKDALDARAKKLCSGEEKPKTVEENSQQLI